MGKAVERLISSEQLERASVNYLSCLRLPSSSRVLVITDKAPEKTAPYDPHRIIRMDMTSYLIDEIFRSGHQVVGNVRFDEKYSKDQLKEETKRALEELNERAKKEGVTGPTTVVYLGNDWPERFGIYDAINEFGKSRNEKIRLAGSLGFTTGDCRVLSDLSKEKIEDITEAGDRFEKFFEKQPEGLFEVTTRDVEGKEHNLNLHYDTTKAPFVAEFGNFDGVHEHAPNDELQNISYLNIPGGEIYGTPYPFKKANGSFSAEAITFYVENGLLVDIQISKKVDTNTLITSQNELIVRVRATKDKDNLLYGKFLPIAELGIGFYQLAGVKTYSDSSTLSAEKTGPHIAFGHGFKSPEAEETSRLSGDFYHCDFVLDHPAIMWIDPKDQSNRKEFYVFRNGI